MTPCTNTGLHDIPAGKKTPDFTVAGRLTTAAKSTAKNTPLRKAVKKMKRLSLLPELSPVDEKEPAGQQMWHVTYPERLAGGQQLRLVSSPTTHSHSPGCPAGSCVKASHICTQK